MPWTPAGRTFLDAALVGSVYEAETGTGDNFALLPFQTSYAFENKWQPKGVKCIGILLGVIRSGSSTLLCPDDP